MKNLILSISLAIIALSRVFAADIIVENPPFSFGSHSNVYITKVVMNDEATYLTMTVHHSPKSWIRIASDTYIRANGNKHVVKSANGIELDKEVYSDNTNKTIFTLKFDPIDPATEQLDFLESDCDGCFKIWGVELKSKVAIKRQKVPQEIIDAATEIKDDGKSLEIPQLKEGIANFKGQLIGYVSGMNWKINIYVNNPVTGIQEELEAQVQEDGRFELQVPLVTTMQVLFRNPIYNDYILLSPDKETILYFDIQQKSCQESRSENKCPESEYMYFIGANAEINNQMNSAKILNYISNLFDTRKQYSDIVGMTTEQYKSYILNKVDVGTKELHQKGLTKKTLELAIINLRFNAMYHLTYASSDLEYAHMTANKLSREDRTKGFTPLVFEEIYYSFLKDLDINNPINLYSNHFGNIVNSCRYLKNGNKPAVNMPDNSFYQQLIKSGEIAPEDMEMVRLAQKQAWDNWDDDMIKSFKENNTKVIRELINSGKLTEKFIDEANQSLALFSDSKNKNVPSLTSSTISLLVGLANNKLLTPDELKGYAERLNTNSEMTEIQKEKVVQFDTKYAGIMTAIRDKKRFENIKSNLENIINAPAELVYELMETQPIGSKIEKYTPLTEADMRSLSKMDNQFYYNYFAKKNNQLLAQIEANKNKKGFNIYEVPEGSDESFFSELMKPFAGKVVFVDFWATWCGPCLSAMKQFEPAKKELQEKGVVFVYLTDESSPLGTWNNMIPTIKGEHFRMKNDQFNTLEKKFGIRGIPSYLILNKKGEQVYFKVGFEGTATLTNLLNKELEK